MMSYRAFWSYAVALFIVAHLFAGCTTKVDYTLGEEYIPTNQNMELKRRVYRAGVMREGDREESISMASTKLYQSDSIKSSNLENVYFGYEKSPIYGDRKAGFMTQVLFGSKLDDDYGWGYRPIFDSMTLSLYITDYHGDTTIKQRFGVYEIRSNDYITNSSDSIFYINFDPTNYIAKDPIFEFTFPNQERGTYVGDIENPRYCNVTLESTDYTQEYVNRLMFTTNLAETDDYGLDTAQIYKQGNEKEFVKYVRGLYIAPIGEPEAGENNDGEKGAMFATNVENSAMVLYARSRYKEDPTIIKDTIIMSYNFYVSPTTYKVKAGNVSISRVEHTFIPEDQASIDGDNVLISKVDGMGGVVTELKFTDEFIQSLADVVLSRKDASVSVNQAHLNIYLEGSDYDYSMINPGSITPILDKSMSRMGLYARYGGTQEGSKSDIIAIADYLYTKEANMSIPYNGYLNRSLALYQMNISNFVQSLMMAAAANTNEEGKVQFEKFEPGGELARTRTIYIAPAADALFGFNRQRVIGGDVEIDGLTNSAPITLEIVYTIVN